MPPGPGTFSMMKRWPSLSPSFSPTMRVEISATPPAANGTMMRIGRSGYFACADAPPVSDRIAGRAGATARPLQTARRDSGEMDGRREYWDIAAPIDSWHRHCRTASGNGGRTNNGPSLTEVYGLTKRRLDAVRRERQVTEAFASCPGNGIGDSCHRRALGTLAGAERSF